MYTSSSSSSSQKSVAPSGLTRYGSAPGSLLNSAVDAVLRGSADSSIGSRPLFGNYFTGDSASITSESTCKVNSSSTDPNGIPSSAAGGSALLRQRSSPAGFFNYPAAAAPNDNGFSVSRGTRSYISQGGSGSGPRVSRLNSQLSFTGCDSLSQISEVCENIDGISSNNGFHGATHSYATSSFGMDSWDTSNSIVFSTPPNKRTKNIDGDILNCLSSLESQFSLPQSPLEMATVDNFLHIPEDSIPCKVRAKRGCATHPRSIAERERRTRISGKLKKLQELVPNMDKQTSYADMLDLAVQHIRGLQNEVQKLQKEVGNCTCGCTRTS